MINLFYIYIYIGPGGNNGKSRWCELLKHMLGSYAYKAAVSLLLGAKQDAASIANFDKKRFIYCEEPSIKQKLQSHVIKDITGGNEVAARKLYSQDTATRICATFALNTNNIPEFTQADEAIDERLITYEWKSKFVKEKEKVNENDNVYLADEYIASKEFAQRYGSQLFNILCLYHKKFMDNNQQISLTLKQKMNNSEILRISDGFKSWIDANIVFTDDKHDYITLPQIEQKFRSSEFWLHLTTTVKLCGAASYVKKQIMNRSELKKWYRKEKVISKGNKQYEGYLIRHKFVSNSILPGYNINSINNQDNQENENDVVDFDNNQYDFINKANEALGLDMNESDLHHDDTENGYVDVNQPDFDWNINNDDTENGYVDTNRPDFDLDINNKENGYVDTNRPDFDLDINNINNKENRYIDSNRLDLDSNVNNIAHFGINIDEYDYENDNNTNHNVLSGKKRLRGKKYSNDLDYPAMKKRKLN